MQNYTKRQKEKLSTDSYKMFVIFRRIQDVSARQTLGQSITARGQPTR